MSRFILFSIFILYSITTDAQKRLYVSAAATGVNDGKSWASAFVDLQTALAQAAAGDSVWVAKGTYLPTKGIDRSISFEIKSKVRVFGGFAGLETQIAQRDWKANPTILSGNIGKANDKMDNTYNVVYMKHSEIGTVLDGFVIREGCALAEDGSTGFDRGLCGGGLYIDGEGWEAYPDIRNCSFRNNSARTYGGGLFANGTRDGSVAPKVQNCLFYENTSLSSGGGAAKLGGSWIERGIDLDSCRFELNYAGEFGGGFYYADTERIDKLEINGCHFVNNTSESTGVAMFVSIGRTKNAKWALSKTVFEKNTSLLSNEIVFTYPNNFEYTDSITIYDCQFLNNNTLSKPIFNIEDFGYKNSSMIISNLEFTNNSGNQILFSCNFTDANNIFMQNLMMNENRAATLLSLKGAEKNILIKNIIAKYNKRPTSNSTGGTIMASTSKKISLEGCMITEQKNEFSVFVSLIRVDTFKIVNSTITGNNVRDPKYGLAKEIKYFSIENSIIENIKDVLKNIAPPGDRYISHSYFDTLDCSIKPPNVNVTCGPGILTGINPLFVAPDSGDYRLQPCSPLVNTGTNTVVQPGSTDLDGKPRIIGGRVDMGAYETDAPALAAAPTITPACADRPNGSIAFEVASGCPPLQQQWNGPGGSSGSDTKNLRPGTYAITVTDSKGSSFSLSVRVPDSSTVALAALSQPVICGDTLGGSATARPSGGQPPYRFAWQGSPLGDSLRTDLAPGQYAVTATDERGCTATGSISVGRTGLLASEAKIGPISCHGSSDGSLTVLPTNGKKPYTWLWDNGPGNATRAPLGPGQYGLTLSDAFGCDIVWLLPLTEPERLREDMVSITKTSGATASDGKIALSIQGGTPPHTANWKHGATGLTIENLKAGEYTVTVTDKNGCTFSMTYVVGVTSSAGEPKAPAFSIAPNPTTGPLLLSLQEPAPIAAPLRLFDAQGRLLRQWTLPQGAQQFGVQVGDLPTGVYQLVWRGGAIVVAVQ